MRVKKDGKAKRIYPSQTPYDQRDSGVSIGESAMAGETYRRRRSGDHPDWHQAEESLREQRQQMAGQNHQEGKR